MAAASSGRWVAARFGLPQHSCIAACSCFCPLVGCAQAEGPSDDGAQLSLSKAELAALPTTKPYVRSACKRLNVRHPTKGVRELLISLDDLDESKVWEEALYGAVAADTESLSDEHKKARLEWVEAKRKTWHEAIDMAAARGQRCCATPCRCARPPVLHRVPRGVAAACVAHLPPPLVTCADRADCCCCQASTGSLETYAHYKRGRTQSGWTRSWVVFDGVSGSLNWRKHAGDRKAIGALAMHRFQVRGRARSGGAKCVPVRASRRKAAGRNGGLRLRVVVGVAAVPHVPTASVPIPSRLAAGARAAQGRQRAAGRAAPAVAAPRGPGLRCGGVS